MWVSSCSNALPAADLVVELESTIVIVEVGHPRIRRYERAIGVTASCVTMGFDCVSRVHEETEPSTEESESEEQER